MGSRGEYFLQQRISGHFRGIIVDNDGCDPQSWNNHGSIEEVNGQWYVFYHRSSQNRQQKRRLCIEPIFFMEDGTIQEVLMTSQGAGRPFGINENIEAFRACQLAGSVYIAPLKNGDEGLTGIQDGDEAVYRYVDWEKAVNSVSIEAIGSGKINIYLDDQQESSGNIILKDGRIVASSFKGSTGKHEIKLQFNQVNDLEVHSLCFRLEGV